MSKVIAVTNHKGGVGKTTSAVNIGAGLSSLGKHVLLIDCDPQANLTHSLGIKNPEFTVYGFIKGQCDLTITNIVDNLDLLPSNIDLAGLEVELSAEEGREYTLRNLIKPIIDEYDFVLIDCPPSLGLLTINALVASDEVYIPLQAQYLALQGLTKLLEIIDRIQKGLNSSLRMGGLFVTQYDGWKILHRNVAETLREHFKDKVFRTTIRNNIALAEAPAQGLDIFRYRLRSHGASDYMELSKEILRKYRKQEVKYG